MYRIPSCVLSRNPLFGFLLICCIATAIDAGAQYSRSRNRSGQVYRNNYQRMAGSGNSGQRFSIRNGALWASGRNSFGQLGDGTTTDRSLQVRIGTATNWVLLSSDSIHTLGIRADGTLWSWGNNAYGQLGDGTTTSHNAPVQVGSGTNWVAVSTGLYHSVALRSDGTVWTWGYNSSGQLGNGGTANGTSPAQISGLTNITSIAAGREHNIALRSDGTLWAWGLNASGQLGNGATTNLVSPVQIGAVTSWASIAAGGDASFGIRANGTLWAFGDNRYGQLGNGSTTSGNTPAQVGTDQNWTSVSAGNSHTLALKSTGTLWSWGRNSSAQLGDGTAVDRSVPVQVGTASDFVQIIAGSEASAALSADGTVRSWGSNANGVFGNGSTASAAMPVIVEGTPAQWMAASMSYHTMQLKSDGTIWGVGYNSTGGLGDGTNTDRATPVQIGAAQNWVSLCAGMEFTLGLTADGKLYSWGDNSSGQLGINSNIARNVPGQIGAAISWSQVATGMNHAAGISSDGKLYCWGDNSVGQVGDGTSGNQRRVPTQIGSATDWVSVVCAANSTIALRADGTLYSWGYNLTGTLGIGGSSNRSSPTAISGSNFTALAAGGNFVLALKGNGTLWAWGFNGYGQLGDGGSTNRTSPFQIGTATNWMRVSCGGLHGNALAADGTFYSWGNNASGELGDGTSNNQGTPQQIPGLSNVAALLHSSPVSTNSASISANRATICLTGYNQFGELADGSTITKYSFGCANDICAKYQLAGSARTLSLSLASTGNRTDFQSGCEIAGSVMPTVPNPVSGDLTAKSWIEGTLPSYGGRPVLARHFEMTPAQNASTATADITLYVSQSDFDAYNATSGHGYNLPSSPADPLNEADNIRILKFSGSSSDGSGLPASYSGTPLRIRASAVRYDSVAGLWKITFPVTGFSGFFIQSSVFALPVELLRFDAKALSEQLVQLSWELGKSGVGQEYGIERSGDGQNFESIGSVPGTQSNAYRFNDAAPLRGRSWYRLKTLRPDGGAEYSKTISVTTNSQGGLQLSPSPARDWIELRNGGAATEATVLDLQGRSLLHCAVGPLSRIDVRSLSAGVYLLRTDAGDVVRLIKD